MIYNEYNNTYNTGGFNHRNNIKCVIISDAKVLSNSIMLETVIGNHITKTIEALYVPYDGDNELTSNDCMTLVIGGYVISVTNIFHKCEIDGIQLYRVDFFANYVALPCNLIIYHKIEICHIDQSGAEHPVEVAYYKAVDEEIHSTSEFVEIKLVYHIPDSMPSYMRNMMDRLVIDTGKIKTYYPGAHNVLRVMSGMAGLAYANAEPIHY